MQCYAMQTEITSKHAFKNINTEGIKIWPYKNRYCGYVTS